MKKHLLFKVLMVLMAIVTILPMTAYPTYAANSNINQSLSSPALDIRSSITADISASLEKTAQTSNIIASEPASGASTPLGFPSVGDNATNAGGVPNYFGPESNYLNSPTNIRKFVDSLPGLGSGAANNRGEYIPVAIPDNTTYPGSVYYEIALVEYTQKLHTDLNPTILRGYVQLSTTAVPGAHIALRNPDNTTIYKGTGPSAVPAYAVDAPHYLGPMILAQKNLPVRIKFYNLLPIGAGGDLFLPVDKSVMGAADGPNQTGTDPQGKPVYEQYTENRATIHLHGGQTPWISDGTPHQWITPAGENTAYPEGVSVRDVPDMAAPEAGAMTFFYSNQQSARLLWYHDHAWGITRLNVYAGEVAPYLLTDPTEQDLINGDNATGVNPGRLKVLPADEIPLIIQDKTFLPGIAKINANDPTWPFPVNSARSDLWYPHVYMPNQNPNDDTGTNPFGRWDYGPWFWPPWPAVNPPITLSATAPSTIGGVQYFPDGSGNTTINGIVYPAGTIFPNLPNNSAPMEAFMDTPVINGQAYPYLEVDPKAYRFRILNGANDRFFNLGLYQAKDNTTPMWNLDGGGNATTLRSGDAGEIATVSPFTSPLWPADWPTPDSRPSLFPDPAARGPEMIQIGNEGGFLPAPFVHTNIPIGYDLDKRSITVLNVKQHNLFMGPAERADVVVDFSAFQGKTLILYNDSPAPVPAGDWRNDYYTGNDNQTASGGAPSTLPGYGPNTRTLMQIRVKTTAPSAPYNLAALESVFAKTASTPGVFASSQDPIIVPQAGYNSAYNASYPSGKTAYARIQDLSLTFTPQAAAAPITMAFQNKAIHELFENAYGRMNAVLGVEIPFTNGANQTTIPFSYSDPVTENINDSITPLSVVGRDGTQIWKITHNGVDTHPIHFHLFNVQVINRVDWAGVVKPPEPNELGWKETVRMNPLEDCIVAIKAVAPRQPWGQPISVRPLNPAIPIDSNMGFSRVGPDGNPVTIRNQMTDFGSEYVWHCHILAHEEMDMMRPIKLNVITSLPIASNLHGIGSTGTPQIDLTWTDGTPFDYATGLPPTTLGNPSNEIGYLLERAVVTNNVLGPWLTLDPGAPDVSRQFYIMANRTTYADTTVLPNVTYRYRLTALNASGNTFITSNDVMSTAGLPPAVPTLVSPIGGVIVTSLTPTLHWNAANFANTYHLQIATDSNFTAGVINVTGITGTTAVPSLTNLTNYFWHVSATNSIGTSIYSATGQFRAELPPVAPVVLDPPSSVTATQVVLSWTEASANANNYIIQRQTGTGSFTQIGTTVNLTYTAVGLSPNTTYSFRVMAASVNAGNSPWSTPVTTVTTPQAAPSTPTLASPTSGSTVADLVPDLQWNAASRATTYGLQVSTNSVFTALVVNQTGIAATSYTVPAATLYYSTTYYWRVNATNTGGTSGWSSTRNFITPASPIPNAPINLISTSITGNSVALSWTNNAIPIFGGFNIERATGAGAFAQIGTTAYTVTTYTATGLAPNTTYRFQVSAYSGALVSAPSNVLTVTTAGAPPAFPTLSSPASGSTVANTTPLLGWNAVTGATTYEVQIATNSTLTANLRNVTGLTTNSYTVSPALNAATRYYWRVRAVNTSGPSGWSLVRFFNTP